MPRDKKQQLTEIQRTACLVDGRARLRGQTESFEPHTGWSNIFEIASVQQHNRICDTFMGFGSQIVPNFAAFGRPPGHHPGIFAPEERTSRGESFAENEARSPPTIMALILLPQSSKAEVSPLLDPNQHIIGLASCLWSSHPPFPVNFKGAAMAS